MSAIENILAKHAMTPGQKKFLEIQMRKFLRPSIGTVGAEVAPIKLHSRISKDTKKTLVSQALGENQLTNVPALTSKASKLRRRFLSREIGKSTLGATMLKPNLVTGQPYISISETMTRVPKKYRKTSHPIHTAMHETTHVGQLAASSVAPELAFGKALTSKVKPRGGIKQTLRNLQYMGSGQMGTMHLERSADVVGANMGAKALRDMRRAGLVSPRREKAIYDIMSRIEGGSLGLPRRPKASLKERIKRKIKGMKPPEDL